MNNNNAPIVENPFEQSSNNIIVGIVRQELKKLHTCIPAIVKKVISRGEVIVSPAVQQIDVNWKSVEWADIKLPVHSPSGNAILCSSPLTVGDTGWIIAGDLDPTLFFNDMERPARQNTMDRHNYQFGFFLPDKIKGFEISGDDDGGWYIGTADGKTKIVLKDGEVSIVSKSTLKITAENVSINGSSKVEINGTDWKSHQHGVGTLSVPTTSAQGSPSTISGSTGGVE